MARTWVKLHLKILDSYDMELLPDSTYRRAIQLLCIAGKEDADGWLPDPRRIAWQLRIPIEQLAQEMGELREIEYLVYDDVADTWRINHWATYQTNSDPGVNERVQRFRDKHRQNGNAIIKEDGNVTCNVTETDTDKDKDKDKDKILQIKIREDKEIGANAPPASEPTPIQVDLKTKPDPLTAELPGEIEYFRQFHRKRWATEAQRDLFRKTETDVGTANMLQAVAWGAENNISMVKSVCTRARNIAKGPPARAAPGSTAPESVVDKLRYLSQESDRRNGNGKPE